MRRTLILIAAGGLAGTLTLAACKKAPASYPAAKAAAALETICQREYRYSVRAVLTGTTLQAAMWVESLFDENGSLTKEASERVEKLMLCGTRVSLSTDAPLKFLRVTMGNRKTGSRLTLIRYVPDIKDSLFTRISQDEYFNRLVIEMDPFARDFGQPDGSPNWAPPVVMSDFLARQMQTRLRKTEPELTVQAVAQEGERLLSFLVFEPEGSEMNRERFAKVAGACQDVSRAVVRAYRFNGFEEGRVVTATGTLVGRWKL